MTGPKREVHQFIRSHFSREISIGGGGEGHVYLVEDEKVGRMAVKILFRSTGIDNDIRREIENIAMHALHENIVEFFGYVVELRGAEKIVTGYAMEYMTGSSLHSVIHDPQVRYSYTDIANWGQQATSALAYLHSKGAAHRDVKPANMLLSQNWRTLKLCDFGLARQVHDNSTMTYGVGTWSYMAPELISKDSDHGRYCSLCDVYSMGISLWEMTVRKSPFGNMNSYTLPTHILSGGTPCIDEVRVPVMRTIIRSCLSAKVDARPMMERVNVWLQSLHDYLAVEQSRSEPSTPTGPDCDFSWSFSSGATSSSQADDEQILIPADEPSSAVPDVTAMTAEERFHLSCDGIHCIFDELGANVDCWRRNIRLLEQLAPRPIVVGCKSTPPNKPIHYGAEFHGFIPWNEVTSLLHQAGEGAYLVRQSQLPDKTTTLCMMFDNEILKYKLFYDGSHYFGENRFTRIDSLVADILIWLFMGLYGPESLRRLRQGNSNSRSIVLRL